MKPCNAIDEAAKLLCSQRILKLYVDPLRLNYKKPVRFETIQRYCEHTRQIRAQIIHLSSQDGITVLRPGKPPLVLYNEHAPPRRRAFTQAHEVGHIYLNHRDDNPKNEIPANIFAANLLAPRILLWEINRLNGSSAVDISQICTLFLISKRAAQVQFRNLPKSPKAFSDIEWQMLELYKPLLAHPNEPALGF